MVSDSNKSENLVQPQTESLPTVLTGVEIQSETGKSDSISAPAQIQRQSQATRSGRIVNPPKRLNL